MALGGVGLYAVAIAVAVDVLFVPRVSSLQRDTRQLLAEFEGFAAESGRLNRAITAARSELDSGNVAAVRATVADARTATPTSLTTTAREAMAGAPLEMRTAIALAIERESDIRDVLSRTLAYLDLGRTDQAKASLARASLLAGQLVSTMAGAQQAGLRDVASRGQALEVLTRQVSRRLLVLSALGVVLLAGLLLLLHRRLYLPLEALDTGVRRVSQGDLETRVEARRDDELGRLTSLFNRMVEELQDREAERAVERKEVTRRILDASLDAVIVVDPAGCVTSWNPGAESIFGWSASEALGRAFEELIAIPELKERQRTGLLRAMQARRDDPSVRRVEIPARRKDGTEFTAETSIVRISEGGQTVGLVGFIRDVTEQRSAEQALMRSESLLRSLVENSPAVIYVKDLDGRYSLVNRRWLQIFGQTAERVIGERDVDVLPPKVAERVRADDQEVLSSRKSTQFEVRLELPDGPRDMVESRFPLLDMDGKPYALGGVASDVTEILELREQVRRAQRLEAVGRLAGGVAHDFNNLVAVILGQAQLALEDAQEEEVRAGLEEIERAARRAAELTSQLLAFARKQMVSTRVEDVNTLVRDTLTMVSRVLESSVRITPDLGANAGSVEVDPGQFSQVLLNVLMNARDAMAPAGGPVTIVTRRVEFAVPDPSLELAAGSYVLVKVSDEGPGIAEETMDRLFEPFFTTKAEGTGLGLATCHGIVKQAGGGITLDNRPEGGAEVAIFLPRAVVLEG